MVLCNPQLGGPTREGLRTSSRRESGNIFRQVSTRTLDEKEAWLPLRGVRRPEENRLQRGWLLILQGLMYLRREC